MGNITSLTDGLFILVYSLLEYTLIKEIRLIRCRIILRWNLFSSHETATDVSIGCVDSTTPQNCIDNQLPIRLCATFHLTLIMPSNIDSWTANAPFFFIDLPAIPFWQFFSFFLLMRIITSSLDNLETRSVFSMLSYLSCVAKTWLAKKSRQYSL